MSTCCPKMPQSNFVQRAAGVPMKPRCRAANLYDSWVQVKPGHSKGMSWGYLLTTAGMTAAPRPKPYSQVLPVITQMEPSPYIRTCECNWWHTDLCCEELFPGDEQETILTIKHNRPHSRPDCTTRPFFRAKSLCWAKFMESPQRPLQKMSYFMSQEHPLNTDKSLQKIKQL